MQELKFKIDSQREVVIMDIEKLIDNPNNVKIHTQEQIELIKKSIDKLGFNSIVVIDEENMILAGHGRVLALKETGEKTVPCLKISNLSEEEKLQIMMMDNTSVLMTGIDEEMAKLVIEKLELAEADLELTGLSLEKISELKIEDLDIPEVLAIDKQQNEISRETSLKLTFGTRKVIITDEELERLEAKYKEYINEMGVDFGFVSYLLGADA
ncbi:ParB N-terminal domain-containing protein (plasmid) [Cetobacterium somerae]|uniref:ParB/Srx family N-terminal domain-containing protein n=1 Tax=Cetobacterium somerae TaxID=188913 RepID=UPI001F05DDE0|nr:ParB N-terminal domain-containing protein [Cetobacterium somerae]UPO98410.1 ParB N-terminal domain-containing protein [Cetobacterium somerae]